MEERQRLTAEIYNERVGLLSQKLKAAKEENESLHGLINALETLWKSDRERVKELSESLEDKERYCGFLLKMHHNSLAKWEAAEKRVNSLKEHLRFLGHKDDVEIPEN